MLIHIYRPIWLTKYLSKSKPQVWHIPELILAGRVTKMQIPYHQANVRTNAAVKANVRKNISFKLLFILFIILLSSYTILLGLPSMSVMTFLSPLTDNDSQINPSPRPVCSSLVAQKGTIPPATLHITNKMTASPVPAIPVENWSRSLGSSGEVLTESITSVSLRCGSRSSARRHSHA